MSKDSAFRIALKKCNQCFVAPPIKYVFAVETALKFIKIGVSEVHAVAESKYPKNRWLEL